MDTQEGNETSKKERLLDGILGAIVSQISAEDFLLLFLFEDYEDALKHQKDDRLTQALRNVMEYNIGFLDALRKYLPEKMAEAIGAQKVTIEY